MAGVLLAVAAGSAMALSDILDVDRPMAFTPEEARELKIAKPLFSKRMGRVTFTVEPGVCINCGDFSDNGNYGRAMVKARLTGGGYTALLRDQLYDSSFFDGEAQQRLTLAARLTTLKQRSSIGAAAEEASKHLSGAELTTELTIEYRLLDQGEEVGTWVVRSRAASNSNSASFRLAESIDMALKRNLQSLLLSILVDYSPEHEVRARRALANLNAQTDNTRSALGYLLLGIGRVAEATGDAVGSTLSGIAKAGPMFNAEQGARIAEFQRLNNMRLQMLTPPRMPAPEKADAAEPGSNSGSSESDRSSSTVGSSGSRSGGGSSMGSGSRSVDASGSSGSSGASASGSKSSSSSTAASSTAVSASKEAAGSSAEPKKPDGDVVAAQKRRDEEVAASRKREVEEAERKAQADKRRAEDRANELKLKAALERAEQEAAAKREAEDQRRRQDTYLYAVQSRLQLRARHCPDGEGKHYLVGLLPSIRPVEVDCINVHYRASCAGSGVTSTGVIGPFLGNSEGCYSGDTAELSPTPTCKPADVVVTVTAVKSCYKR